MSEPQVINIDNELSLCMQLSPISHSVTAITFSLTNGVSTVVPDGLTVWDATNKVAVKPLNHGSFVICYTDEYVIRYKGKTYNIRRRAGWDITNSSNQSNA
jgi:hypothetical protein